MKFPCPRPDPFNPPAEFAQLRKEHELKQAKTYDNSKVWLVPRYADIQFVLSNDRDFTKVRSTPGFPEFTPGGRLAARLGQTDPTFVDLDPPQHTLYRSMVEHEFSPEAVAKVRPEAERLIDSLLNDIAAKKAQGKSVDLMADFAQPMTAGIICQLLGIPWETYKQVEKLNRIRTNPDSPPAAADEASHAMMAELDKVIATKEAAPGNDIISRLLRDYVQQGKLRRGQAVATTYLLLFAGNETVANALGLGVLTLLKHPEQWRALCQDPSSKAVAAATHEILRYLTISNFATRRVAVRDVKVGEKGCIRRGESFMALLWSGNRDEAAYSGADKFDITRKNPKEHLAYGYGSHKCVGIELANAELSLSLAALARRFPTLKLSVPESEIPFKMSPATDNGLQGLPVTW